MRILWFLLLIGTASCSRLFGQEKHYDTNSVIITRILTKDLFEANSVPFMQPLVTDVNATSNARFYNQAYVPVKVSKPYFKFSINAMYGFVRSDQLEYTPTLPTEKRPLLEILLDTTLLKVVSLSPYKFEIRDTARLAAVVVKRLFQKGLENGKVVLPPKAATVLGYRKEQVTIDKQALVDILKTDPEFSFFYTALDTANKERVVNSVLYLPDQLQLPTGANISKLFAAVPQLEIGSLWGTEMLLRYIPPITWDTSVGKFSFYGIALKHSISQYFGDTSFHVAFQVGYQATNLTNVVGVTASELESSASFWNLNLHASKSIKNICEVYTGLNYETVDIASSFSYIISQEVQLKLGLIGFDTTGGRNVIIKDPKLGYPGDDVVQVSKSNFSDRNLKWTIGAMRAFGPVAIFLDYSVSKFNIFSGGLEVRF